MGDDRVMRWNGSENTPVWSRDGCGPTSVARGTDDTLVVLCDREYWRDEVLCEKPEPAAG